MSRAEILFNDDQIKCNSYLHARQKQMEVCVSRGCNQHPSVVCIECSQVIHEQHDPVISSQEFVRETNSRYKQMQENIFKLEGQLSLFQNQAQTVKKQYNGEIEKIKNVILSHLDTMNQIVHLNIEKAEKLIRDTVQVQIYEVKQLIDPLRAHRLGQLSQDQVSNIIRILWHSDLDVNLQRSKSILAECLGPIQSYLKESMIALTSDINNLFLDYKNSQQSYLTEGLTQLTDELKHHPGNALKQSGKSNEIQDLITERDQLHKQIINISQTSKYECFKIKSYYDYYYLVSNYSQYVEIPICRQGKMRRINDRMHEVVHRLYELAYRDDGEKDFIWAYFIR